MSNKLTYEEVFNTIKESGCLLLETNYISTKTFMNIRCTCGDPFETNFDNFKNGSRCKKCRYKKMANSRKTKYEIVKSTFEKFGCTLVSKEFISSKEPLDYICVCGNPSTTTYEVMKKGHLCRKCGSEKSAPSRRVPYKDVKKVFESKGCILLTPEKEYKGVTYVVDYTCHCGEPADVIASCFYSGNQDGCMKCAWKRRAEVYQEMYGVDNPMQVQEIKEKSLQTAYENGTFPTSSQQLYIHSLIGGELNYPVGTSPLDIAFPDKKIYVEYNGGLHDGKVKFGVKTEKEFQDNERRRRYALFNRGWKEIRIVSSKDRLPKTEDKIKEMIEYAINYLQDRHWIEFNLDENKVKSSQFDKEYDFGKTFMFIKQRHSKLIKYNHKNNAI